MYPQQISDYAFDVSNHFRDWAIDEQIDPDKFCEIVQDEICKEVLPKWLNDSDDFELNDDELLEVIKISFTEYNLYSLQSKGLVDSIENEHGETIWFATEKGSKVITQENPDLDI